MDREWGKNMRITRKQLVTIAVGIICTTLSYAINYYVNLGSLNGGKPAGAVVAASTVGVLSAFFFKDYAVAGYIAAFAGMSATTVIPSIWYAPVFGFMAGGIHVAHGEAVCGVWW